MPTFLAQLAASAVLNRRGGVRPMFIVFFVFGGLFALVLPILVPTALLFLIASGGSTATATTTISGCATTTSAGSLAAALSINGDTTAAQLAQLGDQQIANARSVLAVAQEYKIPVYGRVIALATALQESRLVNVTVAVNQDSLGVFQQRPSSGWGTPAQVTDVSYAARAFFGVLGHGRPPGLLQVTGWPQLTVAAAAQSVQRSAFPTLYAGDEPLARQLVTELDPTATGADQCGTGASMTCSPTGLSIETDLTPDAVRVLRCLHQQFPQLEQFIGNYPARGDSDHNTGRAVDAMIPDWTTARGAALGWQIARWERAHAGELGIKYLIFDRKIWSVARTSEGWRAYINPYGDTDPSGEHLNHVHTSVYGNTAGTTGAGLGDIGLPVRGPYRVGAAFGECGSHWAACHTGQDFVVGTGTPVLAVTAGTVIGVSNGGPYGRLTRIDHGHGVQTWYAHQSRQDVHVGDRVTAGQQIGLSGATGNTTGPHLHLEVRLGGTPVDPVAWLHAHGVDLFGTGT